MRHKSNASSIILCALEIKRIINRVASNGSQTCRQFYNLDRKLIVSSVMLWSSKVKRIANRITCIESQTDHQLCYAHASKVKRSVNQKCYVKRSQTHFQSLYMYWCKNVKTVVNRTTYIENKTYRKLFCAHRKWHASSTVLQISEVK